MKKERRLISTFVILDIQRQLITTTSRKPVLGPTFTNALRTRYCTSCPKRKAQKRQREELSFDFAYDEIGHDLNDIIPSNENIESDVIKKEEVANLYKTIKKIRCKRTIYN